MIADECPINNQNSHYYLRCLVKIADERPLNYEEIPQDFINFFTLPGLSQAINIKINNRPEIDYEKVENYFKINESFSDFNKLAAAIKDYFESDYEKLYACFYFVANHVKYDHERSLLKERKPLTIQTVFDTKSGVCAEYAKLFRELAKMCGIMSNKLLILPFINASKGAGWNSYNPPSEPDYNHEAVYIEINGQSFISEPTWAAGSSNEFDQFIPNYHKDYFLIPYYKGLIDHFPEEKVNESLNGNFTYDQFTCFNRSDIKRELLFESNIKQKMTVENGFYEMQFSFIQPVESIFGELCLREDNNWQIQNKKYISYECLAKNLPSINFSYSKSERCRYKLAISFPKNGEYRLETYLNTSLLFTSYFDVKGVTDKLIGIPGSNKEKYGFIPIIPREGLTKITDGFARIRFAVKFSRSNILMSMYEVEKGSLDNRKEMKFENNNWYNFFTTNLPFNYDSKEEDLKDYLVEDWVLINFPQDGFFEVEIYFFNEADQKYYTGVSYYFDVSGTQKEKIIYPFFDLPNNRTFAPVTVNGTEDVRLDPPGQTIVLENGDFYFHVFSEKEYCVKFKEVYTGKGSNPDIMPPEGNDDGKLINRKYSSTHLTKGFYQLLIFENNQAPIITQNYFILDSKLPKESSNDKQLMKDLKHHLEGKYDYLKDVPTEIRKDVEKMVAKSIKDFKPINEMSTVDGEISELESEEDRAKLKQKIIDLENEKSRLKQIVSELENQKEEQEKHSNSLEQEKNKLNLKVSELTKLKEDQEKVVQSLENEKNEINSRLNDLMKQKENLNSQSSENDKEKTEMLTKLKDLEQRKQELEKRANNLEQENDNLNNKFNELSKQKEEQENRAKNLEQEKNELNKKAVELEKLKEEITKNMEKEKSNSDSKIHSLEIKINELEKEIKNQENRAKNLEQEKNEINDKLKRNEDTKMIEKLKELENQTNLIEKEKNSMNSKISELLKQKEDYESNVRLLELKNNQTNQKIEQLLSQIEDLNNKSLEHENEKNEMVTKLKEFKQKKQELKKRATNLEHEKDDLNSKFNDLAVQKEEQENRAKKLEKEKNELNKNVVELEKQKEEIIKNMEKEKEIADSKILSFENRINELMKEKVEQENRAKNFEKEKKKLSKHVIKLEKMIEEINSRERTSNENEIKPIKDDKEPNQNERKLIQKEKKPIQNEMKQIEEEKEPNQNKRKSIQEEPKPNQNKIRMINEEPEPNKNERKLVQKEKEPIQNEIKPIKENIKSNQTKEEEDDMIQNKEKILQDQDISKLPSIKSPIKEPNTKPIESPSPRRKMRQPYDPSTLDQLILPQTPPKRVKCKRPIKLTVTLKDIGMENFDQPYDKLPTLVNHEKITNYQDENKKDSKREDGERSLPKLSNQKQNVKLLLQTQEQITQTMPLKIKNSPRKKKEISYHYDPSIFYTPLYPHSPVGPVRYYKDPVQLTVTLKDIGLEELED